MILLKSNPDLKLWLNLYENLVQLIKPEIDRINRFVSKKLLSYKENLGDDYTEWIELTAFGAERMVREMPPILFGEYSKLFELRYSLTNKDIQTVSAQIDKHKKAIIKAIDDVQPTNATNQMGELYYDEIFLPNYDNLIDDLTNSIDVVKQRIKARYNSEARNKKEIWLPIIISFASFLVAVTSIIMSLTK